MVAGRREGNCFPSRKFSAVAVVVFPIFLWHRRTSPPVEIHGERSPPGGALYPTLSFLLPSSFSPHDFASLPEWPLSVIHRPGNVVKHRLLTRYDRSFPLYEEKLLDVVDAGFEDVYIFLTTLKIRLISLFRDRVWINRSFSKIFIR